MAEDRAGASGPGPISTRTINATRHAERREMNAQGIRMGQPCRFPDRVSSVAVMVRLRPVNDLLLGTDDGRRTLEADAASVARRRAFGAESTQAERRGRGRVTGTASCAQFDVTAATGQRYGLVNGQPPLSDRIPR